MKMYGQIPRKIYVPKIDIKEYSTKSYIENYVARVPGYFISPSFQGSYS